MEMVNNPNCYKAGPAAKIITLKVKVMLDSVPGWGDDAQDHVNVLFNNPYVQSATVVEEG